MMPTLAISRNGAGPVLLMLHGIGSSRTAWQMQFDRLSDGFDCIAPDLPGYGDSPATRSGLAGIVDAVAELISGRTAHVVGVSFGGLLSLALARAYPERVGSLILADTTLGRARAPESERAAWLAHRRLLANDLVSRARQRAIEIAAPGAPEHVINTMAEHMRRARPEGYVAVAEAIAASDALPWLAQIHQPALVICGQHDSVTGMSVSRQLADNLPNADFVEIADAGHAPHIEQPDRFAEIVRAFLGNTIASRRAGRHR